MCADKVRKGPWSLEFVPGHLNTQEMCAEAGGKKPWFMLYIPGPIKQRRYVQRQHAKSRSCYILLKSFSS